MTQDPSAGQGRVDCGLPTPVSSVHLGCTYARSDCLLLILGRLRLGIEGGIVAGGATGGNDGPRNHRTIAQGVNPATVWGSSLF